MRYKGPRDLALDESDGALAAAAAAAAAAVAAPLLFGDLVVKLLELGVEGRGPVRDGVARGLERGSFFFWGGEEFLFFGKKGLLRSEEKNGERREREKKKRRRG